MERLVFDQQTTWLTADTHFSYENMIEYCNRPFQSAAEHDDGNSTRKVRTRELHSPC